MSDASAAVAISNDLYVVADDENNVLRVYNSGYASEPIFSYDLSAFIVNDPNYPEADLEGATMIGDRIYWISSHGRNKDGKMRSSRYCFFATGVKVDSAGVEFTPVGIVCRQLIHRMIESDMTTKLDLDKATRFDATRLKKKERKNLAPKKEGANIEGLCATPDGEILYIGFRNPQYFDRADSKRKAIIVPLSNPKKVIEKGETPIFGDPILLNMDGLGIRSMEYSRFHDSYFIIAGPRDEKSGFALYRWSGTKGEAPVMVYSFPAKENIITPEALIAIENSGILMILSDDGSMIVDISDSSECMKGKMLKNGKCLNKYLSNQNKKTFRGMFLKL